MAFIDTIQNLFGWLPPVNSLINQYRMEDALAEQEAGSIYASGKLQKGRQAISDLYQPLIKTGDAYLNMLQSGIESGMFSPDESVFNKFNYSDIPLFNYDQQAPTFRAYQPSQAPGEFSYNQQLPSFTLYAPEQPQPELYRAPEAPKATYYDASQFKYDIENDPVYQSRLQAAQKAIETSAAARGTQLSGATLNQLQQEAQNIASQEGQNAFNRWMDQQKFLRESTRYMSEDEYRRYLDSVGIRGAEADKAIAQWNLNRAFGQEANIQNLEAQTNLYNLGYKTAADIYGMNYDRYRDIRDFGQSATVQNYLTGLQGYNTAFQNALDAYKTNADVYNTNRTFEYGRLSDIYNRRAQAAQNLYGMIKDLANLSTVGRSALAGATSDYYTNLANLELGSANARAALEAGKTKSSLDWFLGK